MYYAMGEWRAWRMAALFPIRLCKAIFEGFWNQLKKDGVVFEGVVGMHDIDQTNNATTTPTRASPRDLCAFEHAEVDGHILTFDSGEGPFFDDLIKQERPTLLVKAARRKELDYFESRTVWRRVPVTEAWRVSGRPPISDRWVDVNKGDDDCPDIRSRLVARQIRGANEDPLFGPTPPLEALRTVLSYGASDLDGEQPKCRDGASPNGSSCH